MSEADSERDSMDELTEKLSRYRDVRDRIERSTLPLATSVDGRAFDFQASLHGLLLRRGAYVVLEHAGGRRFGQISDLSMRTADVEVPVADGPTTRVTIRVAVGQGLLLDQGGPVHDARVRPASSDEVSDWLEGTKRRDRASLVIGELMLAPGVPAALDSGGFTRHTFMCGQSGSGKTYSLGLLLEKVLAETSLRIVILDPNSDYVGLGRVRDEADLTLAERHRAIAQDVAVWSNEPGADHQLKLRFAELDTRTQGAVLGLDPIADRGEYAALSELLRANESGQQAPVTGLDQLVHSQDPDVRQLGMRAVNLGILGWTVWGPEERSLLQEIKEPTSRCLVVDLGSLETLAEQRMVADAVLGSLWGLRRTRQPALVVIDEAHNVCAAEPEHAVSRITTERAIQIAAEGRKYGLYLLVSTQRPSKVHENVVSQCDNLLLMRMNSMADVADLTRLFSFVPLGLMAGAPSFGLGQALVSGPLFPQGAAYVQMGARVSQEGGADIPTTWATARTS